MNLPIYGVGHIISGPEGDEIFNIDINESNRLSNEEIFEEQEVMILRKNESQSHSKEIALKSY